LVISETYLKSKENKRLRVVCSVLIVLPYARLGFGFIKKCNDELKILECPILSDMAIYEPLKLTEIYRAITFYSFKVLLRAR